MFLLDLLPFSGSADEPVSDQAEPEIDGHAHVEVQRRWRAKGGSEGKSRKDTTFPKTIAKSIWRRLPLHE